jgi:hypothetical protein
MTLLHCLVMWQGDESASLLQCDSNIQRTLKWASIDGPLWTPYSRELLYAIQLRSSIIGHSHNIAGLGPLRPSSDGAIDLRSKIVKVCCNPNRRPKCSDYMNINAGFYHIRALVNAQIIGYFVPDKTAVVPESQLLALLLDDEVAVLYALRAIVKDF